MKLNRLFLLVAILAPALFGSGCAAPPERQWPQQTVELRDYPGQSYFCYLHKQDPGC